MSTVPTFSPTYYEATPLKNQKVRLTDGDTEKPVSTEDPFYQEKQDGGKCSVHSMRAFAGSKRAVDITELFKLNNKVQKDAFAEDGMFGHGQSDTDTLKTCGVYLETIKDLDENGVPPLVIKSYIETYKDKFDLPVGSSMSITEGVYTDATIQNEIEKVQKSGSLHRVVLGIDGKHYLTIRKDKAREWHVIDSQQKPHDLSTQDKTKKIQPRFKTLKDAVEHVTKSYKNKACILIHPTMEKPSGRSWGLYARTVVIAVGIAALAFVSTRTR